MKQSVPTGQLNLCKQHRSACPVGVLASESRPLLCDVAEQMGSVPRWLPNELCRPCPSSPSWLGSVRPASVSWSRQGGFGCVPALGCAGWQACEPVWASVTLGRQVVDTPGILDQPLEDRNTIEMQAITALAHLRAAVLYVMDVSEQCGHGLQAQLELFRNIRPLFVGKVSGGQCPSPACCGEAATTSLPVFLSSLSWSWPTSAMCGG